MGIIKRLTAAHYRKEIQEIEQQKTSLNQKIEIIIEKSFSEYDWMYHVIGSWDCEHSPFGICMYHNFEDPAHDNCIFCHQPNERK